MQWVALIAVAVAALDQLSKWLIVRSLTEDESRVVINGFFSLVNWPNTGTAWSILQNCNPVLVVVSLLALLGMFFFRRSFPLNRPGWRIALGLIMGGIVGNLIDRVRVHHVTDFLFFYVGRYKWPAFNVADSAICCGVGLYIILSWRNDVAARKSQTVVSS
jgi:signal peptidase II